MATNTASNFNTQGPYGLGDIQTYIQEKLLPLTQNQLVVYQFGDKARLPRGKGTTYQASRYIRVPLPFAALSEGVPPVGQTMTLQMVSATAQQWGDKITITDVAEITIMHPLFQTAIELTSLDISETYERNTFNNLMGGTQINYVNSRGSRFALQAGDVLNPYELTRATVMLRQIGARAFSGPDGTDIKVDANGGPGARASSSPKSMPHYVAVLPHLVQGDLMQNSTIVTAFSYSDVNRLYNAEIGEWQGIRFCASNLMPSWTGVAQVNGSAGTAGSLATNTYYIIVTASDTQNQYESRVYQVSAGISVTGPTGSISVTTPSTTGYTYNVYVGTTTSPTTLGLSASGPTVGPMAGQAVQLPASTAVVITGTGTSQTPPAPVATGVTVYPVFIFGKSAYSIVTLDDIKITYLRDADKSDPLNQLRVIGWKVFWGVLIQNQQFFMRIECTSAFSTTFG